MIGCVGLIQNLGALRALATEGISQGHMKLHIKNLILSENVAFGDQAELERSLQHILDEQSYISSQDVHKCLEELRDQS